MVGLGVAAHAELRGNVPVGFAVPRSTAHFQGSVPDAVAPPDLCLVPALSEAPPVSSPGRAKDGGGNRDRRPPWFIAGSPAAHHAAPARGVSALSERGLDNATDNMNFLTALVRRLIEVIRALSPSCREATRLQSDALDRALPLLKQVGLRIHLVLCRWCRRYGGQIRFLRRAARSHSDATAQATPSLTPKARQRIIDAVHKNAA